MDWITALAVFGAVGTALSLADLAYKYGPNLLRKTRSFRVSRLFRKSSPLLDQRGTSFAAPRIALELAAASPELRASLIKKTAQINKSILKKTY